MGTSTQLSKAFQMCKEVFIVEGLVGLNVYARFGFTLYCIFSMRLCSTLIAFKSMKRKRRAVPDMLARDSKGFTR